MARLYRIYTQDYPNLGEITVKYFPDGFTIFSGIGYWKGGSEKNATIEIIDFEESDETSKKIKELMAEIKATNHQEAILKADWKVYAILR